MEITRHEDTLVICEEHPLYLKVTYKGKHIDLPTAIEMVNQRQNFTKGKKHIMLVDTRNILSISFDARKYWASEEATKDVIFGALLIEGLIASMVGNFYIKVSKPKVKSVLFTKEEEAIKWIKKEVFKRKLIKNKHSL